MIDILFYFTLSRDYCFISRIVKLRLSTFFQNKEQDDDDGCHAKWSLVFLCVFDLV